MHTLLHVLSAATDPTLPHSAQQSGAWGLDPGDAGWGDVIFVVIWAVASLLLGGYYCYKAFFTRA